MTTTPAHEAAATTRRHDMKVRTRRPTGEAARECLPTGMPVTTQQGRDPRPTPAPERFETVIVGGGQAGLAIGYHLARRGRRFVILDANQRVGDAWRRRWDSLRLFTPARYDGLPGMPFPAPAFSYPHQGSGRRLPGGLRDAVRPAGAHRRPRGPALQERGPVRACRRRPPVPRRPRGGGVGRLPAASDPRLRRRARPGHPAAGSQPLPGPVPAPRRRRPGGGHRQLRSRDRLRSLPHPPDLAVGPGHRPHPGPHRQQVGPAAHPAVLVVRLAGADREHADRPQGSTQGPDHDRAAGTGAAQGAGRRRSPTGSARTVGVRDGSPLLEDGRVMDVATVLWCTGFRPDFAFIDLPVFDQDGARHTTAASSGPSPACTSWGCGSCRHSPPRCSAESAATPSTSPSRSPPANPTAGRRRRS